MTQALQRADGGAAIVESVVINGDLAKLAPAERVDYYRSVCDSLGLNPLTKPFEYITLNNKLTLYARKDATDQLRASRNISVQIVARDFLQDAGLYVVTARAVTKDGRTDESVGAVNIKGLQGENLANALMKAETKAKRRVTLSCAGLGWLDESEMGSIPDARPVHVDEETGEIAEPARINPPAAPKAEAKSAIPAWITELQAWAASQGLKMVDLAAPLKLERVTVVTLKAWAESLPRTKDPLAHAKSLVAKKAEPEPPFGSEEEESDDDWIPEDSLDDE